MRIINSFNSIVKKELEYVVAIYVEITNISFTIYMYSTNYEILKECPFIE